MDKALKKYFPIFVLPTALAFTIGFVVPFILGIYLSFCKFSTVSNAQFVGISNYVKIWGDATFVHSLWFTALFALASIIFINFFAYTIALLLTKRIRGANLFRTVFFMPNLIGGIILGYIWQLIFNGILSYYARTLTFSAAYGFWGLLILMCWQQVGYMMIIYIAGLQSVPEDILEAARIDGANGWQTLFKVTIPNVMPSITICTFLTLTNSFKLFDQNIALTEGRPFIQAAGQTIKTTEMLALNIYNSFYQSTTNRGVGQAKAVIFFVLVAAISILQLSSSRKKEVQQ